MPVAAAIALVLSLQTAAPAFEFREFTTSLTQAEAWDRNLVFRNGRTINYCQTRQTVGRAVSYCPLSEPARQQGLAGVYISRGQAGFDTQGLVTFVLLVDGGDAATVRSAMTAKFGESCETSVGEWRNRLGAVLENPIMTWCLSDGRLSVSGRSGQDPDLAEVRFVASRLLEPTAPAVDF